MEPEREAHQPWEELFDGSPCWKPSVKSSYDGYDSGGKVGPSNAITQTLRTQKTLCSAFFFIFLVTCDCNKCFFCKIGKTNGIYHKVLVTESKKTGKCLGRKKRKKNIQCTNDRQLLSNCTSGQYCRQCYRDQKSLVLTTNEKWRNCRFTRMGCPACKEPICDECWDNGYKNEYNRP